MDEGYSAYNTTQFIMATLGFRLTIIPFTHSPWRHHWNEP
ncbi:hypothetical protein VRK_29550 [Vibrio sp. MEBiC08052]|nr:hypothetical protein VRK_29550 [Vibrio sp. MEBiC08052]